MRALETKYNGYRFRSRTEARWAMFLDEIYIKYEYEKEGFLFDGGITYLPDFYLPDLKTWIEVKGDTPTSEEIEKCRLLRDNRSERVVLIHGIPDPNTALFYTFDEHGEHGSISARYLALYLQEIIEQEYPGMEECILRNGEEVAADLLKAMREGRQILFPKANKKIRLKKAHISVLKLINQESEYEGDEYAFGVAKSARFGEVA